MEVVSTRRRTFCFISSFLRFTLLKFPIRALIRTERALDNRRDKKLLAFWTKPLIIEFHVVVLHSATWKFVLCMLRAPFFVCCCSHRRCLSFLKCRISLSLFGSLYQSGLVGAMSRNSSSNKTP